MEKKVKAAAKKTETVANKSLTKINKTVKNINEEVTATVEGVMGDVKISSKEIRAVVAKSAKEVAKKMNTTKNINKIKATAEKVNNQIQETLSEVFEDVKASGKEMQANAAKMAKEAIENIDVTERVGAVKKAVKKANNYTLETAEEMVDGMIVNGEKWQNIAAKAVKSGFKVAERQQEMMFSTLEAVKGQLGNSAVRLRNIFKNN